MGSYTSATKRAPSGSEEIDSLRAEVRDLEARLKATLDLLDRQQSELAAQASSIARLDSMLMQIVTGRTWRTLQTFAKLVKKFGGLPSVARDAGGSGESRTADYHRWIKNFEQPESQLMDVKATALTSRPLISIAMPVFDTDPGELEQAIQSVIDQSYPHWELCIADDCSTRLDTRQVLEKFSALDERIIVAYRSERGGISSASNTALSLARGEYIAFLDHDDLLARHALAYICQLLEEKPGADLIYSDEDKIDAAGRRFDPFLKPDWSPDLLLSENYICHLLVLRNSLLEKAGKFNSKTDGSQDYDLILRSVEKADRICHIPKVLYHWRTSAGSAAADALNKPYASQAAREALQAHCERVGFGCKVEPGRVPGRWRVRYAVTHAERVSILIASGGKTDVLRTNLESLLNKTTYRNYEVVIIDNSSAGAIEKLVSAFRVRTSNIRYLDWRSKPFNYSEINNAAARQCDSPLLLFLNDDTSVIEEGWLDAMVELILRPEVGAVGAKLLYPNGRIQHAGVVMGLHENCGHAFGALDGRVQHYFDFPDVIRNVSAVTGACLMTKAELFREVGGFDEVTFPVAFNDVDYCLKLGERGYRILYTPHALLHHHEAFSKTAKDFVPRSEEVEAMRARWGHVIAADPYYNPNLTRETPDYTLRKK